MLWLQHATSSAAEQGLKSELPQPALRVGPGSLLLVAQSITMVVAKRTKCIEASTLQRTKIRCNENFSKTIILFQVHLSHLCYVSSHCLSNTAQSTFSTPMPISALSFNSGSSSAQRRSSLISTRRRGDHRFPSTQTQPVPRGRLYWGAQCRKRELNKSW